MSHDTSLFINIIKICIFFFFSSRRRHTRYWRDWSSDVCSSDLVNDLTNAATLAHLLKYDSILGNLKAAIKAEEIGRASCRERGVDLGGRRIIKKKKKKRTNEEL